MKRLFIAALLGAGALLIAAPSPEARPRQTATAKRLSVLDYYFLLPHISIGGGESRSEKREMLRGEPKPVIDLRHDYLLVHPDSSPAAQVAVFRGGGADVIAYSTPDFKSDYNKFRLYRLQNGKLRDVTKQIMPVPARTDRFLYELPRFGTTIHVFAFNIETRTRKPAFNLLWRRGRFVVARLKRDAKRKAKVAKGPKL